MPPGWSTARLDDILSEYPPEWWAQWAEDSEFGARWRSVRTHFGITGFGVNANAADAGRQLVPRHDEDAFGGQEELYVVVRGRAQFTCDGEEVELGELEALHVAPSVTRSAVALETPTVVLMVGGVPGSYTPDWD